MFKTVTETKNCHKITGTDFLAIVRMNPRDAMVFCQVMKIPEHKEAAQNILENFRTYFYDNYGAKSIIQTKAEYYDAFIAAGFSGTPLGAARFVKLADFNYLDIKSKTSVSMHLKNFTTGKYKTLLSAQDYAGRYLELFQFKKQNAAFVTEEKIEKGIYSEEAERDKIANEFVRHFAIEENGEIIATVMVAIHGDMAYVADYIIRADKRNIGLGQAFIVHVFEQLNEELARVGVDKIWFIAGGDGQSPVGIRLYSRIFASLEIDASVQKKYGLLVNFGPPKPALLLAAGRVAEIDPDASVCLNFT